MSSYFNNIKRYVGFSELDASALRELAEPAEPYLEGFSDHFYERIADHPDALKVLESPEQLSRLKRKLVEWMQSGLLGPHDQAFYQRRSRIGRVHVRIALPQQYMFTAMNVLRLDFRHLINQLFAADPERLRAMSDAIDKLFDLELAIMLQTYQEDSEERLRRRERLATIGQIAASIGHDLRNPLSVIQSSLYLLRKRLVQDERAQRHLARIDAQVELCESTISNLLQLARNQPPQRATIDFQEIFRLAIAGVTVPPHIQIAVDIEPGLSVEGDAGLLRPAIANLIVNAIDAYDKQPGTVYLKAMSEDGHAAIEVADDGPGFDSDTLTRAFEPLVTTRATGTGLGLALVKGVTERHGGSVLAYNRPHGGAAVRIRLPKGVGVDGEEP